jgi:hypothetical protein
MSIDRQFGVHEIPGTEEAAPRRDVGLERQINQIWSKLAEHDEKLSELSSQGRPMLVSDEGGAAKGERYGDEFGQKPGVRAVPPKPDKPWEAEGVSRRTWYRRHPKEASA